MSKLQNQSSSIKDTSSSLSTYRKRRVTILSQMERESIMKEDIFEHQKHNAPEQHKMNFTNFEQFMKSFKEDHEKHF